MAPIGTLYTYPNNVRAAKALIAAKYAGVEIEIAENFTLGVTNKEASFTEKFPLGKVPAMTLPTGEGIFESNAIATYAASFNADELLGANAVERAQIVQYTQWFENEVVPAASVWLYPIFGYLKYNKEAHNKAVSDVKKFLEVFDKVLATRTFLVGNRVTLADIMAVAAILRLYTLVLDPSFRAPYVNVNRYFITLVNQPNFVAVLGEVKLAEQATVYDPAVHATQDEKNKAAKAAEKAKAEEEKKAAEKAEKAAIAAADEEEESYEDKPAAKNPLDMLPPTTFNLEAWKRFYSNNTEEASIKFFWENFDAAGYSIYLTKYKYNDENKAVYMTCNLLNGTFQRWERVRKYAFGSFCIFGVDNDNEAHGIWVFRGPGIPAEIAEADDCDSFEFTKLDITKTEDKERINAFLAWGEIPGVASFHGLTNKTFDQGKLFK